MKDMLNRLAKADPETYGRIMAGLPIVPRATYYVLDAETGKPRAEAYKEGWISIGDLLPEAAMAWLQAVLQDAITSRGWLWTLSAEDKGHPTGAPYTCHLWDEDINEMVMDISGGSPAQALLKTYLKAIESGSA